ncbi:MAG: glycosyltransferase family 2 protein [Candidatus Cloacimonetes bacterium]|nr:glycosyltransferase family 2 protein [Candidatus Cloacimonadota bacterium]
MLLTVACICKNEEEFLPGFLKNVMPFADQLVIVDTGSKDKTLDILKKEGINPYHFSWNQDFSEARNVSLDKASGDFVLVLDIDERIRAEDFKKLRQELVRLDSDLVYLPIHNLLQENWEECAFYSDVQQNIRLFRNHRGLKFSGKIHEVIEETPGISTSRLEIPILHLGYANQRREKKTIRNMEIIKEGYLKDPEDPFYCFYYALSRMGEMDIRPLLKRALHKSRDALRYQIACELLEESLFHKDMSSFQDVELILEGMKPDCSVLWYCRAKIALNENQLAKARICLERAKAGLLTEAYLPMSLMRDVYQNLVVVMAMQNELKNADLLLRELLQKVMLDPHLFYLGLKIAFAQRDKSRFFELLMQAPDKELGVLSETQRLEIAQWMRSMGQG